MYLVYNYSNAGPECQAMSNVINPNAWASVHSGHFKISHSHYLNNAQLMFIYIALGFDMWIKQRGMNQFCLFVHLSVQILTISTTSL